MSKKRNVWLVNKPVRKKEAGRIRHGKGKVLWKVNSS